MYIGLPAGDFSGMATSLLLARSRARPVPCIPWLGVLDATRRDAVAAAIEMRPVVRGDVIVRRGDELQDWYGVVQGFVTLAHAGGLADMLDTGVPARGWFGDHHLLAGVASDCTVTARTTGVVACLPARLFRELVHTEPGFAQLVLRLEVQRFAGLRARLAWPRRMPTDAWVACRLAALFEPRDLFAGEFRVGLTQAGLADFLGLSRQRTNQALNALRCRGAIEQAYGDIRIPDPGKLAALALGGHFAWGGSNSKE